MNDENLIQIVQIPIIEERLKKAKEKVDFIVEESSSLICTEETVQAIKKNRTSNRALYDYISSQLKAAKDQLLAPFYPIEKYCKEQLLEPLKYLDERQKQDISYVEDEVIKKRCEERLRDYFSELCAVHHVEWLRYEMAGIKIDMASAKAKTPAKLQKQLLEFVVRVSNDIRAISEMEDAVELLVEYKECLDFAKAFGIVQERNRRREEERKASEERKEILDRESESVRRVEALSPPTIVEEEQTYQCTFTVTATKSQLRKLKEFLNMEGIQYE